MNLVTEYLKLGLRFDRVVSGYVDAYTGDPELKSQIADEPAPNPAELSRQAAELVRQLPSSGLPADRAAFLTAHLQALQVGGAKLAGEPLSLVTEVRSYFQVEIQLVPTEVYADAHARLAELVGGSGPLPQRIATLRSRDSCPPELVEPAVEALAAALRDRVTQLTELPPTEHVDFEIEQDVAWSGFNYYLGRYRSRVAVNADVGHRMSQLPALVAHECYPGHHTEHCRKEALLVEQGNQQEQTIFLVNTPQCLMAEGLGDLALTAAVGPSWGHWAVDVLDGIGPRFEPELAEQIELALRPLNTVRQNAAIMLHDRHADPDEVLIYLQRWSLADARRSQQMLRFLSDPLWRAYSSTYVEGERLLRPWLTAALAPGEDSWHRFQRLLDEPLTPELISAELTSVNQSVRG